MKINIKTTNFNMTDNTRDYVLKKMDKIGKLIQSINLPQEANIEVGRTTEHHAKDDHLFMAEVNLKMGKTLLRSVSEEWDIKVAINSMCDGLEREVRKFKDKQSVKSKKGAREIKEMMRGLE